MGKQKKNQKPKKQTLIVVYIIVALVLILCALWLIWLKQSSYYGTYTSDGYGIVLKPHGVCETYTPSKDDFPEEYRVCTYRVEDGKIYISQYHKYETLDRHTKRTDEGYVYVNNDKVEYKLEEEEAILGKNGLLFRNMTYTKL